ncbi:metal ABC transporter permease [Mycoplasmatota bacterium]|nr:metal ABC transporter permease [Mycoplasmatota bacterium]
MIELLQYDFFQNALIIGVALAISAALLSPFLVLNHQAMIADGLAHVSFAGLTLGILLTNEPLLISVPFVIIASLLIKYLSSKMNGDAAIGLVSAFAFAIGLIIIKKGEGFNYSVESLISGNIFTPASTLVTLGVMTTGLILSFILIFYRKLFLMTYDYNYAKFSGIKVQILGYALSVLTAFFIAIGVRTIGVLLISAFVIFPSIISSQFTKSFMMTLIYGLVTSVIITISGIFIAHPLGIPVGATIVVLYTLLIGLILMYKRFIRGEVV